ncbi:MAG: hypothetical protein ACI8RD_003202 [Bacillariaceae sp.]|jgi:hypothetical protein
MTQFLVREETVYLMWTKQIKIPTQTQRQTPESYPPSDSFRFVQMLRRKSRRELSLKTELLNASD